MKRKEEIQNEIEHLTNKLRKVNVVVEHLKKKREVETMKVRVKLEKELKQTKETAKGISNLIPISPISTMALHIIMITFFFRSRSGAALGFLVLSALTVACSQLSFFYILYDHN